MGKKIGVLIVEDSESLLQLMVRAIDRDEELEVRGVARDGQEAIEKAQTLKPDVITMDLMLPKVDGFEAIRQIMAVRPTPIVVVTSASDSKSSFEAIRAGALEVVSKPQMVHTPEGAKSLASILRTVKIMSQVKVLTHKPLTKLGSPLTNPKLARPDFSSPLPLKLTTTRDIKEITTNPRIVAIASSTGGPPALNKVLSRITNKFPLPILIVQHITVGFGQGLVDWLSTTIGPHVIEAKDGVLPLPGHIYIAPDNYHLLVDNTGRLKLSSGLPIKGHRPAANLLFETVGQYYGPTALGIILTGMGDDGTAGMKILKQERGFCIAQDEASCVVFGMPKAAIDAGLADLILGLDDIGPYLQNLGNKLAPKFSLS